METTTPVFVFLLLHICAFVMKIFFDATRKNKVTNGEVITSTVYYATLIILWVTAGRFPENELLKWWLIFSTIFFLLSGTRLVYVKNDARKQTIGSLNLILGIIGIFICLNLYIPVTAC